MAAVLLGGLAFSQSAFAGASSGGPGQAKVTICHQGDEGPETITVGAPAVPAHLAHGDILGECSVGTSCQECIETWDAALLACGEPNFCGKQVSLIMAECSLTCTEDYLDVPQECWNGVASSFDDCMTAADSDEAVDACLVQFDIDISTCAAGP